MDYSEVTAEFMSALKDSYYHNRAGEPTDFLRGECRLLSYLSLDCAKSYPSGELARELGISTARMATILKALERKALVRREISAEDKRRVLVSITDEGVLYIEKKRTDAYCFFERLFERLNEDECRGFLSAVHKMMEK